MMNSFASTLVGAPLSTEQKGAITILAFIPILFTVLFLTRPSRYRADFNRAKRRGVFADHDRESQTSVQVVVLGDIGRSPRMQYHAMSLAKHNARVYLVGYAESELHPSISRNDLITIVPIRSTPSFLANSPAVLFPILGPLKAIFQALYLYHALAYSTPATTYILVQNPPTIPVLPVALAISRLRSTRLVIDWHNLGFSVLALRFPNSHTNPLVRLARAIELRLSRAATVHFAVSAAMASFLTRNISGADPTPLVLYDRPAPAFKPITSPAARAATLHKISPIKPHAAALAQGTTRLLVSSTSWSADEDFGLLLSALVAYSSEAARRPDLPHLLAVITGKGPRKAYYLKRIAALEEEGRLGGVTVRTAWLAHKDYAGLLGCADLGLSLHRSTSGLDLPMKVVDMFGAGLPVAGWCGFEAWGELVKEGANGLGFEDTQGLVAVLLKVFDGEGALLKRLKEGAMTESEHRWDAQWDQVAGKAMGLVEQDRPSEQ